MSNSTTPADTDAGDDLQRSRELSLPRDVPVEFRNATLQVDTVNFAERTIEIIAVPYDEESRGPVKGPDGRLRPELVERGAFDGIDRGADVTVNREHDRARTFGKVVGYRTDDPRGLVTTIYASDTPLGDETLRLAADGVLKASVGMLVRRSDQRVDRNGVRRIKRAFLDHIALLPNAAFSGAKVLAVRQEQSGVQVDEVDPADEAAWETARRIEAMASKIQRR